MSENKNTADRNLAVAISYPQDPIIEEVLRRIAKRADQGMVKFGVSMQDADHPIVYWLDQAIEEAMDLAVYLTKLKCLLTNESEEEMYRRLMSKWVHKQP